MSKIVTIVGARPQFIKAATVSRELIRSGIQEVLIHTGQHFDSNMSDVFFDEMDIPRPNHQLAINGLSHGSMTGRMLEKIEELLIVEKPDLTLVYGDTNSTLAGALASSKLKIPVAHVEAGLRSFDMNMPEEVNRILTDRISALLFCPTDLAIKNLEKEGFRDFNCQLIKTGDVMYDAVLYYRQKALTTSTILKQEELQAGKFILTTLHRAENTNDPVRLSAICKALNEIHKQLPVILPLHPRTKKYISHHGIELNVRVVEPVGYFDMISLLQNCKMVLTDSGGLQKEAYFFQKFCITLRDQTEWIELIEEGANEITGADTNTILHAFERNREKKVSVKPLYGNGDAVGKIVQALLATLQHKQAR